jgi:hypothetical protein
MWQRAMDAGEDFVPLSGKFPTTTVRAGVVTHDAETTLTDDAYTEYFATASRIGSPLLCRLTADCATSAGQRLVGDGYRNSKGGERQACPDLNRPPD